MYCTLEGMCYCVYDELGVYGVYMCAMSLLMVHK